MGGSHCELCPSVHDCGVVPVPARFVSVVVEPGQGDRELCICLPVQCNLHWVSWADVRFSPQPAMDMGMNMVRQGDGTDRRAGIFGDGGNDGEEVCSRRRWVPSGSPVFWPVQ